MWTVIKKAEKDGEIEEILVNGIQLRFFHRLMTQKIEALKESFSLQI